MTLLQLDGTVSSTTPPPPPTAEFPLWRLGFRPFFLAGAVFAILSVALWIAACLGALPPALFTWNPLGGWLGWHQHEMPFGVATAIVAGFLLTVVQNWTGQPGLHGKPLIILVSLWCAARLCWLTGLPWAFAAATGLAFLLFLAYVTGRILWKVKQKHNYLAPCTVLLLALADALALAGVASGNSDWQYNAAMAAIWLIVALMTMIGGRVIPFFTQMGLRRPDAITSWLWLDAALMAGALVVAILTALGDGREPQPAFALVFAALAVGHAVRLGRWYDAGIWRVPLLWSLHLACLWMVVGFAGLALFHGGWLASSSYALHALTVGAMGGLILAMISRVSLGHTGRPLQAPAAMSWAFILLNLATVARVFIAPWHYPAALTLAAVCWTAAFGLFAWHYAPMLCRARVDGRPG
ncbi:hypothetical protein AGMMS49543_04790 [Betaproteobacteria bacterium]|nr:hypothetical protein AGMMS49543_04790 [Betaproteobacteria bacterium]GHU20388.1 hypothetical protein AGMMS50243_14890 [Betaproteobacteria bacterium]